MPCSFGKVSLLTTVWAGAIAGAVAGIEATTGFDAVSVDVVTARATGRLGGGATG